MPTPRKKPTPGSTAGPLITRADFELEEAIRELDPKHKTNLLAASPNAAKGALALTQAALKPTVRKRRYIPPKRIQPTAGTLFEIPHAEICELMEEFELEYVDDPGYDQIRKLYTRYPTRRYYAFRPLPGSPCDALPGQSPHTAAAYNLLARPYEAAMSLCRSFNTVHGAPYVYTAEPHTDNKGIPTARAGENPLGWNWLIVMLIEFNAHSKWTTDEISTWELFPEKEKK